MVSKRLEDKEMGDFTALFEEVCPCSLPGQGKERGF
jgi:hypothetical protein